MQSNLELKPEIGVPYSKKVPYTDLRLRAEAACNTAHILTDFGLDIIPEEKDNETAAELLAAYAAAPEQTSKDINNTAAAKLPPPALVAVHGVLTTFGHAVVESSVQIRNLVTNKLLEETENPDSRVRLRALELLGKISDVGLFTEKAEITITHRTTDELRENLREKLNKLKQAEEAEVIEDAVITEPGDETDA